MLQIRDSSGAGSEDGKSVSSVQTMRHGQTRANLSSWIGRGELRRSL
jgi:hypothetical protein